MILTAHQPTYLPWLGLFAKIAQADTFVLFDDVRYTPRSFENRNKIWTPHGPQWLTVPVLHTRETKIKDVQINNTVPWQRKHWKSIEQNYHKAKYWDVYSGGLSYYYEHPGQWTGWADLAYWMMDWLMAAVGIKRFVIRASAYQFAGTKSDAIIDMCQQLGATTYLFGSEGKSYAEVEKFEAAGIEVKFQDYQHPTYSQFGGEFQSHLSIIDLLLHHGPKAKEILLT